MEAKEYQEIINTADCNAEVNYTSFLGEQKILSWAKTLIDITYKAGEQEGIEKAVKWVEENLGYLYLDKHGWQAFKESIKEGK